MSQCSLFLYQGRKEWNLTYGSQCSLFLYLGRKERNLTFWNNNHIRVSVLPFPISRYKQTEGNLLPTYLFSSVTSNRGSNDSLGLSMSSDRTWEGAFRHSLVHSSLPRYVLPFHFVFFNSIQTETVKNYPIYRIKVIFHCRYVRWKLINQVANHAS